MGSLDYMGNRLAAIQIGKKALGMCDDSYRILLKDMFGKQSAKDLTETEKGKLLDRFQKLGFKPTKKKAYPGKPKNFGQNEPLAKIEAQLADMKLPWSYADAIAKRQFGIDKVEWIKTRYQFSAIIAALHVEQEKLGLLASFTEILAKQGMTIEQFETKYSKQLKQGWKRNRRTLRALIDQFLNVDAG
jgi:phage gp16-like protein